MTQKEIGQEIRKLRILSGLTQIELSEKSGVKRLNLVKVEQGIGLKIETVITLLDALNKRISIIDSKEDMLKELALKIESVNELKNRIEQIKKIRS